MAKIVADGRSDIPNLGANCAEARSAGRFVICHHKRDHSLRVRAVTFKSVFNALNLILSADVIAPRLSPLKYVEPSHWIMLPLSLISPIIRASKPKKKN